MARLRANAHRAWTTKGLVSATLFGAIYLLLHGLVKVVLLWAVLKDKLWAYPWMIAFRGVFIPSKPMTDLWMRPTITVGWPQSLQ